MSFTLPSVRSELILSRDSAKSSFLGSHLLFLSQPIKCYNKRANTYTLCFSNVPFSISSKHYIDVFPLHTDVKNACIKTIQHFQCTAPVLLCHHNTVSLFLQSPSLFHQLRKHFILPESHPSYSRWCLRLRLCYENQINLNICMRNIQQKENNNFTSKSGWCFRMYFQIFFFLEMEGSFIMQSDF